MIRAFTGAGAEQRAERAGHWLKALAGSSASIAWCARQKLAMVKATNETIGGAGGFLTPIELDQAIISVRDTVGAFRNADIRITVTDSKVTPRRVGGLTAYFVPEGSTLTESSLMLDAVGSALKKLGILARTSAELWEDEAASLAEFIASEVGYAFAATEDDCGFNGDGTSPYSGIRGLGTMLTGNKSASLAASGHNTFLTLDSTDIANVMGSVLATAIPGAKWYISALGYAQTMCRLAGVGGGLVARTNRDGTVSANYLGFPVAFSAKLPNVSTTLTGKPMLYFGNLQMSSLITEHRTGTILATSAERAMDRDQILVRGTQREDIINHSVGDATTLGPIAALIGN